MPVTPEHRRSRRIRALLAGVIAGAVLAVPMPSVVGAGDTDPVETPPTTVNEFLPVDRDLTDCISALPKPGCGSEARGGPQQAAVFGALVLGLGVIGTRIALAVRRRDRGAKSGKWGKS